ncbi:MAG: 2'-5' RNA ligase family protein [Chitinophagaceae bacterium]
MEASISTVPGYRMNDYRIVINPHTDLQNKVADIRTQFCKDYRIVSNGGYKPSVTIVRFSQLEMFEPKIINRLKQIALGFPPFKVELRDFGSFPSHTIYINIVSKIPVQNLTKEIRRDTQRLMKSSDENKPHFILEPFIPIASKLKPWQYEKGWLEFSNRHFTSRFIADSMLLLKRPAEKKSWQILQRFEFMNLPVSTKQGELFV